MYFTLKDRKIIKARLKVKLDKLSFIIIMHPETTASPFQHPHSSICNILFLNRTIYLQSLNNQSADTIISLLSQKTMTSPKPNNKHNK